MIFGDHVTAAPSGAAAEWLADACQGEWGSVGSIVPNRYSGYLRVMPPDRDADDWWESYRAVFDAVAAAGSRHTSTPDHAWFAVWEGYGWANARTMVWVDPSDDAGGRDVERTRALRLREDARRRAAITAGLGEVPRFAVPHRVHYLLTGPVGAATAITEPGSSGRWQRPDLMWPEDRSWFVATDVDFWSLYIGGTEEALADIAAAVRTDVTRVDLDTPLEAED